LLRRTLPVRRAGRLRGRLWMARADVAFPRHCRRELRDFVAAERYGANIAFIEELYEKYRNDPSAVSASWREFFHDYEPELAEELEEEIAVGQTIFVTPSVSEGPGRASGAPPTPPGPSLTLGVTDGQKTVSLRGAAGKIATNMEASLSVPTATSIRNIPVKVLEENRRVINHHLSLTGQPKASYTHI